MMVMEGPVKIDLFPLGASHRMQEPWRPESDPPSSIDGHFWDWLHWLGSKSLRHEDRLVAEELRKMHWFLLGPMGVERGPPGLAEAAEAYLYARAAFALRSRALVDDQLGRQVLAALRRVGLVG